jgi:hypothetical protein
MSANTVVDDENITMWYYPESKILQHKIHKFFSGKTFRDIFTRAADIYEKNGALKYLSDDRAVSAFRKEDMEWSDNNFLPRMKKAGWKYWAIITPESIVGQLTLKDIAGKFSAGGIETKLFPTAEEAKKWLASVS